jgi:hypothetical protein
VRAGWSQGRRRPHQLWVRGRASREGLGSRRGAGRRSYPTRAATEACNPSLCAGSPRGPCTLQGFATRAPTLCWCAVGACHEPCKCRLQGPDVLLGAHA